MDRRLTSPCIYCNKLLDDCVCEFSGEICSAFKREDCPFSKHEICCEGENKNDGTAKFPRSTLPVPILFCRASLFIFLPALLAVSASAEYSMGVQLVQPLKPEPGDVAVFKVALANEPRWSRVLQARVISPDGRIYEAANVGYVDRPNSTIIHEEYLSWRVPEDALEGNYTLEVFAREVNVFQTAHFRVFRYPRVIYENSLLKNVGSAEAREVEIRGSEFYRYVGDLKPNQSLVLEVPCCSTTISYRYDRSYAEAFPASQLSVLQIRAEYQNRTLFVSLNREAEIEILRELPVKVKQTQGDSETRFLPARFKVLGQSYAAGASASFGILPESEFIEIPIRIKAGREERVIFWSGQVMEKAAPAQEIKPAQEPKDYHYAIAALAAVSLLAASFLFYRRKYAGNVIG